MAYCGVTVWWTVFDSGCFVENVMLVYVCSAIEGGEAGVGG